MSSASRSVANTERGTQFYVNTTTIATTDRFDANGTALGGSDTTIACGTSATVGAILVRDMGKTLRVPVNTLTGNGTASAVKYRILRKVQLVVVADMTTAATNSGNSNTDGVSAASGATSGLLPGGCFYIELGGTTVSGAALAVKFASTTVPY